VSLNRGFRSGFTLIEVMVAIVLIGIAVSALVGGLATLTNVNRRSVEKERLVQMAHQKLDELLGTGDWTSVSEGEYEEEWLENFEWSSETETTSVEGLEWLRVTVTQTGPSAERSESVETLVYRAATTTVPLDDGGQQ
jgi:prepilin-type N-terminal cleavage/methylation domain-containing protein